MGHPLDSDEAICELIRAEIHARGSATRAATIDRVVRLIEPAMAIAAARIAKLCDALEREGDLIFAPGAVLHATPVRAIVVGDCVRVVGSLPTRALAAKLEQHVDVRGASRAMTNTAGLDEAIQALGGVVLAPEAWAGIDHTPIADDQWITALDRRLEWQAGKAASLERDDSLDWAALVLTREGPRWKRGGDPDVRLWQAKNRVGYRQWAWTTVGQPPSAHSFVILTRDEAWRSVFALARVAGTPIAGRAQHVFGSVRLSLSQPLPHAEYRYLSIHAGSVERDDNETAWRVSAATADGVRALLSSRLGVQWEEAGQAAKPPVPTATEPHQPSNHPTPGLTSLDELVPVDLAMGPLLRRLGVRCYRDLLALDLSRIERKTGVGRKKHKRLLALVAEAKQRLVENSSGASGPAPMPSGESVSTQYEDWSPFEALGRIMAREASVLEHAQLKTVRQLRQFLRSTRPREVGPKTYTMLIDRLRRLDSEGYESLVFGGPAPKDITELSERYLARLEARDREFFELRFVKRMTLEETGQRFGLTRERVRQVIETELALDRSAWAPRVLELLEPALAHLEAQGGVALTSKLIQLLGTPPSWAVDLAIELGEIGLRLDVVPRISTTLRPEGFFALLREIRANVEVRLAADMSSFVLGKSLAESGLFIAADELVDFADAMLGVTIDGEKAYLNRHATRSFYLSVLHDAGGPISAEEVARRVNALDPSLEAKPNLAVRNLRRTRQVFSYGHGQWIHQDHLPVPLETLDELAMESLSIVKEAGGAAVSVRRLLKTLIDSGRASNQLTPNLLRDALLRTGKVRGWRASTDVAWLGGDVQRRTIGEWLVEVAPELEQPFTLEELAAEVATRSGYLKPSIMTQMSPMSDALIPLTEAEWIARDALFDSMKEFRDAVEYVRRLVSEQALVSARPSNFKAPPLRKLVAEYGNGLLWGLASRAEGIVTRAKGLLMWPATRGPTLWGVIRGEFLTRHPVSRAANLSAYLASVSGLVDDVIAQALMPEGVHEGHVRAIGMGWYVDNHVPLEQQVELLEQQPEVVRMALGSQDFVRESPARELLNELRERHGSFRVPPG